MAVVTPEAEKESIRDITSSSESQIKKGNTFYLITQRWWQGWLEYVNQIPLAGEQHGLVSLSDAKRPSSIDNSDLINGSTSLESTSEIELHNTLVERKDYILLPEAVWNQLYAWGLHETTWLGSWFTFVLILMYLIGNPLISINPYVIRVQQFPLSSDGNDDSSKVLSNSGSP